LTISKFRRSSSRCSSRVSRQRWLHNKRAALQRTLRRCSSPGCFSSWPWARTLLCMTAFRPLDTRRWGRALILAPSGGWFAAVPPSLRPRALPVVKQQPPGCTTGRLLRQSTKFTFALLLPGGAVHSRAPRGMPVPGRVPISAAVALASRRRALLACTAACFVKAVLIALGGLVHPTA